jgi:hypothetical protein
MKSGCAMSESDGQEHEALTTQIAAVPVSDRQEYVALRTEMKQRSGFQQTYLLWDITAAGAVLAFALNEESTQPFASQSLLVVLLLSFVLFVLWIHHAFAIIDMSEYIRKQLKPDGREGRKDEGLTGLEKSIKHSALVVALLGNFVGISFISVFVSLPRIDWENWIDLTLFRLCLLVLVLNFLAFVLWFWRQYSPKGAQDTR